MGDWKIEISPSSKATCGECGKKIDKDVIRWRHQYPDIYNHPKYQFFHYSCGKTVLYHDVNTIIGMIAKAEVDKLQYDKIIKKLNKE